MALHKDFPDSPYAILDPALRWFPADEALRESSSEKLMPPLRRKAKEWRDSGYVGTAKTSKSLHAVLFFGDDDGQMVALDSKDGRHLWHFNTGQRLTASPITYEVAGKQYVAIATATDVMAFGLFEAVPSEPLVKERVED